MMKRYGNDVAPSRHRLVVKRFSPIFKSHECEWDGKRTVFVDLFINGDLPDGLSEEDLIGKTVEVDHTHGFLWLAHGVRVLEEEDAL